MSKNFWKLVNDVIRGSDIVLHVIDARFPEDSRNREIEDRVKDAGKRILYVINKTDLVGIELAKEIARGIQPSVFVSSKEKLGGTILLKSILKMSEGKSVTVGVVGYPNVGKSSVINLLKGKKSSSVSPQAGHTRGIQKIKARGKIHLLDTPGVLQYDETDTLRKVILGSINPAQLDDPVTCAMQLADRYKALTTGYFGIEVSDDPYDYLEQVAIDRNMLQKGGVPDLRRLSVQFLQDWQKGAVHEKMKR